MSTLIKLLRTGFFGVKKPDQFAEIAGPIEIGMFINIVDVNIQRKKLGLNPFFTSSFVQASNWLTPWDGYASMSPIAIGGDAD